MITSASRASPRPFYALAAPFWPGILSQVLEPGDHGTGPVEQIGPSVKLGWDDCRNPEPARMLAEAVGQDQGALHVV